MRKLLSLASAIMLTACSADPRLLPPAERATYAKAKVAGGYTDIRYWGDTAPQYLHEFIDRHYGNTADHPVRSKRYDILALSGGADDGAYGAGFLKGWSDRGDMPEFHLVTGVSTGALMAPFVFLGPEYQPVIKRFYTESTNDDVFSLSIVSALTGGSSLGSSDPLLKILEDEIDADFITKLAEEHRAGRVLLIGSTNLDAQRQMIWDIGAIAESGLPDAASLIHRILLSSASIPEVFPPIAIDVDIDGKQHQELHVDGGVTHEIFAYPSAIDVGALASQAKAPPERNMWLIRNTKINPDFKAVDAGVIGIAGRAVSTMIKFQGRGDLIELERLADRDGFDFHLTFVPDDFHVQSNDLFDPVYMSALYDIGVKAGASGEAWVASVP